MQTSKRSKKNIFETLTSYLPLLWLSLAFLLGILFAWQVPATTERWLILAGGALALAILIRVLLPLMVSRKSRLPLSTIFLFTLSLVTFFVGAARYQLTIPKVDDQYIAWYNDREDEIVVTGTLVDLPDERDTYTNLRVEVTSVNPGGGLINVHGLILARIPPGETWHYGDVIRLRGHLKTPPEFEDFSYRDYLARQGIRAYMPDAEATRLPFTRGNAVLRLLYGFKEHGFANIYRIFPDPEASLLAGILLGNDNGLSADLQQAFRNTGTAHIIAISGFNITIIAGLFVLIFGRLLGRRRGVILAILGIVIYTVLVGASASVVRAAIMGGLAILARQLGRRQNGINTLAVTAAVMAVVNPHTLWDVGFQLSVSATLGLILYAQPFQDWFTGLLARRLPLETARKIASPVGVYVLFTLAAQLTTLPIMAYHFGYISLVSFLANPFILPVQPLVMILGGLALLLSFIFIPLGQVAAWLAWPFSAYTIRAVEFFDQLPHGTIALADFSFLFVILFYAVLLAVTFGGLRVKGILRPLLTPVVVLAALGVLTYQVWSAAFAAPDGRLHLTFLEVGSADAVLIQTPDGRAVLINGGAVPSKLSEAIGRRVSPFDRSLDWLVVASTQENQVGALPRTLDRFPPQNVLWAGDVGASYSSELLDRWLAENGVPIQHAELGMQLDLGKGALLEVVSVSPRGAVLMVSWNGFRALLPIGMNFETLVELEDGQTIGPVTVLLLGDSGFAQVNPPQWLASLRPQLAILSVASGDPDGLPAQSVLNRLKNSTLLRTDRNGWIDVSTDGQGMWVDVQRR